MTDIANCALQTLLVPHCTYVFTDMPHFSALCFTALRYHAFCTHVLIYFAVLSKSPGTIFPTAFDCVSMSIKHF